MTNSIACCEVKALANNKKYYYLKLKDDFFDTDSMIILESMPDGYKYANILLKLYLRSLKNEGKLMFNERIPYNSTILAQVTRHSVGDVEKAIEVFKHLELIEVLDNGAIFITDIQNFIGRSSTEADRKRDYRLRIENEKKKELGQMSDKCPDKSPPEREIELEREKELEKDSKNGQKNKEKSKEEIQKIKKSPAAASEHYENTIGALTPYVIEDIKHYFEKFDEPNPIIIEALDISVSRGIRKWNYAKAILKSWHGKGLKTLDDIRESENEKNQAESQSLNIDEL